MCVLSDHPAECHIWVFFGFFVPLLFSSSSATLFMQHKFQEDCLTVTFGIRSSQVFPISFLNQEMLKCSKNSEGTAELEEALATVLDIIKSVNDSMHQIAITGYEVTAAAPPLLWAIPCSCHHWPCCACGWYCALWSLCHIPEGWHSEVCCDDQKYISVPLSYGAGVWVMWGNNGANAGFWVIAPKTHL